MFFSEKLPSLPLRKEVDFSINLQLGSSLVSIAFYRMAPVELIELKTQLQELLVLGFIKLSTSLWGASTLFVKKANGS